MGKTKNRTNSFSRYSLPIVLSVFGLLFILEEKIFIGRTRPTLLLWTSVMIFIVIVLWRQEKRRKRDEEILRENQARHNEAQSLAHLGHWTIDLVNENLVWSDEVYRIFGMDTEKFDASYETFSETVHPDDREFVQKAYAHSVKNKTPYDIVHRLLLNDGTVKYVNEKCETFYDNDGAALRSIGTVQDITELKNDLLKDRTQELERKAEELEKSETTLRYLLEDANEARTDLEEANKKLKELDRLKSMFFASMPHELRTPLNSIIGFTGVILQGMVGDINAEQRDQLQRVYGAAKHLLALINDVIDISRIEAGKIEPYAEEFQLDEVINEAILNLKKEIESKELGLEVDMPRDLKLKTDRKRLLQSVLNYLSNAVKFTEKGSIIITADEIDGLVEIKVKDTGIGIKEENLPRLFKSFVRLDTPLKVITPGTGLGLYLTKKLAADVLGGEVAVESKYGEGSTFMLKIPKSIKPESSDFLARSAPVS